MGRIFASQGPCTQKCERSHTHTPQPALQATEPTPIPPATPKKWYESVYAMFPIFILIPFIVFYWMMPFISDQTIGNDYPYFSIGSQLEIQYSIKHGSFPLFMPGYGYGNSFTAMTLGQPYHPIAWIAAHLPGYWQGQSLELNTLLHLLSLGITHWVLFLFLRRLRLNYIFSFLISMTAVYNLRMLDMLRYGASLENYTAYLMLCVATAWYYIKPTQYWGPLWITLTTYLLVCGGHAQWMYYGLWGAALLTLVMPLYLPLFLPELKTEWRKALGFYLKVLGWVTAGVLLSSAYTFPFYFDFLHENAGRVNQTYAWSIYVQDSIHGNLNTFFNPFACDVHSSFGGSILFLVAALLPLLKLFRVRIPLAIWLIWGLVPITMVYMLGTATPLHYLCWRYIPFARDFRIPGRVSIIIPIMLVLILAWLVRPGGSKIRWSLAGKVIDLPAYAALALAGATLFVLFTILVPPELPGSAIKYTPDSIRDTPNGAHIVYYDSSLAILGLLIGYSLTRRRLKRTLAVLFILAGSLQMIYVLHYGTWIAQKPNPADPAKTNAVRTLALMDADKEQKLSCIPIICGTGIDSKPVAEHLTRMHQMDPRLAWISGNFTAVSSQIEAYEWLMTAPETERLFIENLPMDIKSSVAPAKGEKNRVELQYSSNNRLVFHTSCVQPAFLVYSAPYFSNHWRAWLGGAQTTIYRANGVYQAVRIPAGEATVEFRYWSSAAFWGVIFSCLTAAGMALYLLTALRAGPRRILCMCLAVGLFVGLFLLWYHSLYTGDNLGTRYAVEFWAS